MKKAFIFVLKIYQITFSPILRVLFGRGCRYETTCSEYAVVAVQKYGVVKGSVLAIRRLSTCHL